MTKVKKPPVKLSQAAMYDIVQTPVITEKATRITEFHQVTFKVRINATKPEIKQAVEAIFGVTVKAVNTIRVKGKKKLFRGRPGRRSDYKKALVTLAQGQAIDVTSGV